MSEPRRIVRREAGQGTTDADDILVDDTGQRWRRSFDTNDTGTVPRRFGELRDGWIFPR